MDDEKFDKAFGQFRLKALDLFRFEKHGYKEQNEGAVKAMLVLINQLRERLKGNDIPIGTPEQLRRREVYNPDD